MHVGDMSQPGIPGRRINPWRHSPVPHSVPTVPQPIPATACSGDQGLVTTEIAPARRRLMSRE
eukprot:355827-Chlamydomonas_euryale.AAC.16